MIRFEGSLIQVNEDEIRSLAGRRVGRGRHQHRGTIGHSGRLGTPRSTVHLLINLLTWLDRTAEVSIEQTAGTACALNTLGLRSGRRDLTKVALRVLTSLDTKLCPVVKLLRTAAKAEVAHDRRQWRRLERLAKTAKAQILKLDPADHWEIKAVFRYLRNSMAASSPGLSRRYLGLSDEC